jgi:hypothetical protein
MCLDEAVRMVLQTLLLRRNFPCPQFFGLGEGPESTLSGHSLVGSDTEGMREKAVFG